MRTITRIARPSCLEKQSPNQDWSDFIGTPCHREVDQSLRREQLGLCCYCELSVSDGDGHVEHMEPRNPRPYKRRFGTYDYANLALSCDGAAVDHCGRYKDDR